MNEKWSTQDPRLLDFFNRREKVLPFNVVYLDRGYFQAKGEWDGFVFWSGKVKRRVVKKIMRK